MQPLFNKRNPHVTLTQTWGGNKYLYREEALDDFQVCNPGTILFVAQRYRQLHLYDGLVSAHARYNRPNRNLNAEMRN